MIVLYMFFGCFSTFTEKDFSPQLLITDPPEEYRNLEGSVYNQGELIPFTLTIDDPDSGPQFIEVEILSNLDGVLFAGTPDSDGNVSIIDSSLRPGVHQISVSVTQAEHFLSKTFPISINAIPVISEVIIQPQNPRTIDDLYADIVSVSDEEGDEVWLDIEWLQSGVEVGEVNTTLSSENTTKDERWSVRVTPRDYNGEGEAIVTSVVIEDSPPQIDSISISHVETEQQGGAYYNDQSFECVVQASDADGDSFVVKYVWMKYDDDWNVVEADTDVFTPASTIIQPEDRLYCGAYFDTEFIPSSVVKSYIDIDNRIPTLENVAITSNDGLAVGSQIACHANIQELDQSESVLEYLWYNDGPSGVSGQGTIIGGSSSLNISPQIASRGDRLTCEVTGYDPHGGVASQYEEITVENSAPQLTQLGVILNPSSPRISDDMECIANGIDVDGDSVTLSYEWIRNGVSLSETGNVLYSGTYGDVEVGDNIRCLVTPIDSEGLSGDTEMAISTIANSPPTLTSLTIHNVPEEIFTDTILVAQAEGVDPNGDTVSFSYDWFVDGAYIVTTQTNSLDGNQYFSKDEIVTVEVTPVDLHGDEGASMVSLGITVLNSPPTIPQISINGEYTHDDHDLLCSIDVPSTDPDQDIIDYNFVWEEVLETGPAVPSYGIFSTIYTDDSVNAIATNVSNQMVCTVTASDGTTDTDAITAETMITSCSFSDVYDLEDGFNDVTNIQDCWLSGMMPVAQIGTEIPFNNYQSNWDSTGLDVYSYNTLEENKPKIVRNLTTTSVQYSNAVFPGDGFAMSPGKDTLSSPDQASFLRWLVPLDGDCQVSLEFLGISPSNTTVGVNLYLDALDNSNDGIVSNVNVLGYLVPTEISEQVEVIAGDKLYIIQFRDPSHGSLIGPVTGHDWMSVSGAIACSFDY
jgi:hypothetical protein